MFKFLHLHKEDEWLIPFSIASAFAIGLSLNLLGTIVFLPLLVLGLTGHALSTTKVYKSYNPKKSVLHLLNCMLGTAIFYAVIALVIYSF